MVEISFREKMVLLLEHWLEHNQAHITELEKWRQQAADEGETVLVDQLQQCIDAMARVSDRLSETRQAL